MLAVAAWTSSAFASAPATASGTIKAKGFLNIGGGTAVTDLTGNAKFPDKPDVVYYYPYFEWNATGDIATAPGNYGDNYGDQLTGYFYPPATGDYTFYISADDNAALYLSTDDDPANKKLIARESIWSNAREYTTSGGSSDLTAKDSSQFTATEWDTKGTAGGAKITLTKGKAYYIETLHKEGGGGDNLSVAVQAPDGSIESTQPIPGKYLSPFAPAASATILVQPQDAAVYAGGIANFSVGLELPPGVSVSSIKWQKNGTDVPNSNATSLSLPVVAGDNGGKIKAIISTSAGGTLTSSDANLSVATFTNEFAPGVVKFEAYTDIGGGTAVNDLITNDKFIAHKPDDVRLIAGINSPSGYGDNYGAEVSGFIIPQETASYYFFLRSDDASQLWLSKDDNAANATMIAEETGCCQAFLEPDSSVTGWHDNGLGMGQTTLTPISLTAGKKYAFYVYLKEGGGGDYVQVATRKQGDATPAASLAPLSGPWVGVNAKPSLGDPQITKQPQAPARVIEGQTVQLTVEATVTPAGYNYPALVQWQKNGTDIPGATANTYLINTAAGADSGTYHAVVSAPSGNKVTSSDAVINVVPDTFPPEVQGATAFPGSTKVGITFDEALDATSAANAANYKVNGAAVTSARVRTNVANEKTTEKNLVELTVGTALNADFTVNISGVKDLKGNAMSSTDVAGKMLPFTVTDIGSPAGQPGGPDPLTPSTVTTWGPGAFDVLCNGNDYWNNADGFNFVWQPKTNSFDVKVRVVSVSPTDNWSAGAIEVREGPPTDNGKGWELARHYFIKTDYGGPDPSIHGTGSGANAYEFNARLAPGDPTVRETGNTGQGLSVGWGGTGPGNPGAPPYPNAWIRIKRVKQATSDHLIGFTSSDGVDWSQRMDVDLNDANHAGYLTDAGKKAGPWPDVCYVGLGSTSHTGVGNTPDTNDGSVGSFPYSPVGKPFMAYVIYRDYGDVTSTPSGSDITLSYTITSAGLVVSWTGSGKLQSKADLSATTWTDVSTTSPATVPIATKGNLFLRVLGQ